MNEQLPEVSALLSDASKKEEREAYDVARGIGRQYIMVVKSLREKNFSFGQIANWFADRGVVLTKAGWRSAWEQHLKEEVDGR